MLLFKVARKELACRGHQILVRFLLKDAQEVENVEQEVLVGHRERVDEGHVLRDRSFLVKRLVV